MVRDIYIAGSGALARVLTDSFDFKEKEKKYSVISYFDLQQKNYYLNYMYVNGKNQVIHDIKHKELIEYLAKRNKFVIGVFKPEFRRNFVNLVGKNNFTKILDGKIGNHTAIGDGSVVMNGGYLMYNAIIKDFVHVHTGSIIGHDVVVGSYTAFGPGCIIGGGTVIGEGCSFGMGVRVLPGIKIGDNVNIGAGAVVTKDILKNNITVFGCPAKEK
jgi:UDP-perosamine 4-acetyltransferase